MVVVLNSKLNKGATILQYHRVIGDETSYDFISLHS